MNTMEIIKCPKNGKRSFATEQQAVDFEQRNREQWGSQPQYVYACEDCPSWHLSSSPPGNNTIAHTQLPVVPETETRKLGKKGIETAEVVRLKESGMTVQEIADHFQVTVPAIYHHLRKENKEESSQLITYEEHRDRRIQLEAEVSKLQEEIKRVKAIEDRLFDQRQLKIGYGPDGVILSKNGNQFSLTKEDLEKLLSEMTSNVAT